MKQIFLFFAVVVFAVFTHPGRRKDNPAARGSFDDKRSVLQVAELKYMNDEITCDRDEPVKIKFK